MKKMLLSAIAVVSLGTTTMAQRIDNSGDVKHHSAEAPYNPFRTKALNKGGEPVSAWYGTMDMYEKSTVSAGLKGYVDFMVHDSMNKFVEDDGTIRYGGSVMVGHVFDPKDDLISLTDNPQNQLSVFNSYKLDSIAFRYLYVRNVDSISDGMGGKTNVTDTVFVTYWKGSQLRRGKLSDNTTFSLPLNGWTFSTRMPANYFDMDTFLLASGSNGMFDTTRALNNNGGFENSWTSKYATLVAPDGMNINAAANGSNLDLLVGFSFIFKSGIPSIVGSDTAVFCYQKDPITAPAGMRRTNYFGYALSLNEGTIPLDYTKSYNTPMMGLKASSYATVNGWSGPIAGQAFNNERFTDAFFHISVDTTGGKPGVGMGENENVKFLGVYPNPATSKLNVTFELANNSDVNVSIVNLVGQEVSSLNFANSAKGTFELPINISNLTPGVYMINITAGNTTQTQKFVVAE